MNYLYANKQSDWIKTNNIHLNSKVKLKREPTNFEAYLYDYGSWIIEMNKYINSVGKVSVITNRGITVDFDDTWFIFPFFVLEPIDDSEEVTQNFSDLKNEYIEWLENNLFTLLDNEVYIGSNYSATIIKSYHNGKFDIRVGDKTYKDIPFMCINL